MPKLNNASLSEEIILGICFVLLNKQKKKIAEAKFHLYTFNIRFIESKYRQITKSGRFVTMIYLLCIFYISLINVNLLTYICRITGDLIAWTRPVEGRSKYHSSFNFCSKVSKFLTKPYWLLEPWATSFRRITGLLQELLEYSFGFTRCSMFGLFQLALPQQTVFISQWQRGAIQCIH